MHGEVVVGEEFRLALVVQNFVRFTLRVQQGGSGHGAVAVAQDMLLPVVPDVEIRILLRLDKDFFLALPVFHPEFVEAAGPVFARSGETPEHGAGFVFRQFIGRHGSRVVNPPGDDGAIRVAFQKGNYDLLPDAGDRHAAVLGAGPPLRHADPAGRRLVLPVPAIPEKTNLHPAVFVGVDFFPRRPRDDGCLPVRDAGPGVVLLRHEAGCRRNGLVGGPVRQAAIGSLVLQRLRLFAAMKAGGDPPLVIDLAARVAVDGKREAGQEAGHIRAALDPACEDALALELDIGVTPPRVAQPVQMGVAVVFQQHGRRGGRAGHIRLIRADGEIRPVFFKVPFPEGNGIAARRHMIMQGGNDGGIGLHARAESVEQAGVSGNSRAAGHVGEAQAMTVFGMLEIVIDALFLAQARDEVQIRLAVLHAVFTGLIFGKAFEGEGFGREALFFQNARDDVRHAGVLENAVIAILIEKPDPGNNDAFVVGEGVSPPQAAHFPRQTVNQPRRSGAIDNGEQRRRADERGDFEAGVAMHQFQSEFIRLADSLLTAQGIHGKAVVSIDGDGEMSGIGGKLHIALLRDRGSARRAGLARRIGVWCGMSYSANTFPLACTILPMPPQCCVASPRRTSGMPLTRTLALPSTHTQVLGPQHALCTPVSPTRSAGLPLMKTLGEAVTAGPVTLWGQQFLPWTSAGQLAWSPRRQTGLDMA